MKHWGGNDLRQMKKQLKSNTVSIVLAQSWGTQRRFSVKYLFGEDWPRIFYYLRTAKNF